MTEATLAEQIKELEDAHMLRGFNKFNPKHCTTCKAIQLLKALESIENSHVASDSTAVIEGFRDKIAARKKFFEDNLGTPSTTKFTSNLPYLLKKQAISEAQFYLDQIDSALSKKQAAGAKAE